MRSGGSTSFSSDPIPVYLIYLNCDDDTVIFPVEQYGLLEFAPTMSDYPADERVPGWHFEVDTFWRRTDTTLNARVVRPGYRPIVPVRSTSYSRYTDMRGATVSTGPIYASTRARFPCRCSPGGVDSEPFILSGPPESLDSAPDFQDPDQLADEQWQERNLDYWAEIDVSSRYRYGVQLVPGLTLDSSEMVGYQLLNTNNQTIGRVEDLIITREGVVLYAEVSFGGFLGLGERRYAIPISALEVDPYHRAAVLDVSRDELDEIPSLGSDALPATGSDWDEAIREFWLDRLLDAAGEYARTAFGETLAARRDGGALRVQWLTGYPVPTHRMGFDPKAGTARLDADSTELRDAPTYPFVERPGVTIDRSWMNDVDEYWDAPGDTITAALPQCRSGS